tara:strand:+ start:79 stop:594 length:516 start_codon:yes stop_codon:yes gene_type:complete
MRFGAARRTLAALVLATVPILTALPQETAESQLDESLEDILSGALTVHINARIIDRNDNETVWTMDLTRVTISGRSVSVRLDGSNIAVVAEFTPYWEDDGQLMLVAQGSTWVTNGENGPHHDYRTSFSTLPIQLGEPIVFLPLGNEQVPVDTGRFGRLNIELEINVERYQS